MEAIPSDRLSDQPSERQANIGYFGDVSRQSQPSLSHFDDVSRRSNNNVIPTRSKPIYLQAVGAECTYQRGPPRLSLRASPSGERGNLVLNGATFAKHNIPALALRGHRPLWDPI